MVGLLFSVALSLGLTAPLQAQMLDRADDLAFQAALSTLLATDDPTAVAALRDLAEAGNTAALVALPFALQWVPPDGNLKEKNAQRRFAGVTAPEAAAMVHEATALWDMGNFDELETVPDRAAGLLTSGEPEKAAFLLWTWVAQTGARGDLPPSLLSDDTPAMIGAFVLSARLRDAVYGGTTAKEEAALLLSLLREDRLVGWATYVLLLKSDPEIFQIVGNPTVGTGLSAAAIKARIDDASAVRQVWFPSGDAPIPGTTAERARLALAGRAELLPVARLCEARCPDSVATCEAAYLAFPGNSFSMTATLQPFADTLDPLTFLGSDRGLYSMIRQRKDPAAAADRATAEGLDACYAGALARWGTLSFAP